MTGDKLPSQRMEAVELALADLGKEVASLKRSQESLQTQLKTLTSGSAKGADHAHSPDPRIYELERKVKQLDSYSHKHGRA
jgi:hypothetical protein